MNGEHKVLLPKLGESIVSATVVHWLKREGERIELDEALVEVSTDKVNSEIPSPYSGVVQKIFAHEGEEIRVGDPLALIVSQRSAAEGAQGAAPPPPPGQQKATTEAKGDFYSPALLKAAQEHGIGMEELNRIPASGQGGRVTKRDLEAYVASRRPPSCSGSSPAVERVKMTGMRKAIADNLSRSFYQAPHATLIQEIDATAVLQCIQREREAFLSKWGAKLTITSFIARALTRAIQEYPMINSSLDQDTIVLKHFVHLGIAVSVDQGLLVPVIHHCQRLSIPEIAQAVAALADRARKGKLLPEDVADGTITMTNFGMFGATIGVPIIRYPEVAIIGIGAIHKRVLVLADDTMGIRSTFYVSLTFDHRVLDGVYGCGFLSAFKKHFEQDTEL